MKSITDFPPDDLALREKLPNMREERREELIRWGMAQPGSMPWLLKRTARYWDKMPPFDLRFPPAEFNAHSLAIDATAALDLLKWRIEAIDDREAVGHLDTVGAARAERRALPVEVPHV